jgi:hypothetical protein
VLPGDGVAGRFVLKRPLDRRCTHQ